jgi:hypothetical protein
MNQKANHQRPCDQNIAVVSQRLREVSVKKRGERPSAATGGAGSKMEQMLPQADVRPPRQHLGWDRHKNRKAE